LCGAVAGCFFALVVVLPFGHHIGRQMALPLLLPDVLNVLFFVVLCVIVSAAIGPLSAAWSAFKISRAETYVTMREGE